MERETMVSKAAVVKEEKLECPPGFTPKPVTRYGGAVVSSPSMGTFDGGGGQLDAPTPIESSSVPPQNQIDDCMSRERQTGESPARETLPFYELRRRPRALPPFPQTHGSDSLIKERRSKLANDIRQVDAEGTQKLVQKQRDEGKWTRQFRSNLKKTVEFFDGVTLRQEHLDCLKRTPFYHLVLPFAKKRITIASVKGTQNGIIQLLLSYDKEKKAFNLGGKDLTITPQECDLIFGIKSGTKMVVGKRASIADSSLAQRKFASYDRLKIQCLKEQLLKYLDSNTRQNVEDTVRIVVIHFLSTVFFITAGDVVNSWIFKICEDIDRLCEYNWGKHIVDFFMNSVHTKEPKCVRGCTPLLLYWICERTTLVNPAREHAFPRFRKWHLKNLKSVLRCTAIKDILPEHVSDVPINKKDLEHAILSGQQEEQYNNTDDAEMVAEEDDHNSDGSRNDNANDADQNYQDNHVSDDDMDTSNLDATIASIAVNQSRSGIKRKRTVRIDGTDNDDFPITPSSPNNIALYTVISEQLTQISDLELKLATTTKEAENWRIKFEEIESKYNNVNVELEKLKADNEALHTNASSLAEETEELKASNTT